VQECLVSFFCDAYPDDFTLVYLVALVIVVKAYKC